MVPKAYCYTSPYLVRVSIYDPGDIPMLVRGAQKLAPASRAITHSPSGLNKP
ncbi:MAG: hypothetical protein K0Q74_349 [Gammaproteobacteria bacterium]|nr:hypothetical protein [Gammaproteobacteria bacterium]